MEIYLAEIMTTKTTLRALERVFAAEINGHLPFQSKARIYQTLNDEGLVAPMERKFGSGMWAATAKGWQLTHAGRLLYCMSCDETEID